MKRFADCGGEVETHTTIDRVFWFCWSLKPGMSFYTTVATVASQRTQPLRAEGKLARLTSSWWCFCTAMRPLTQYQIGCERLHQPETAADDTKLKQLVSVPQIEAALLMAVPSPCLGRGSNPVVCPNQCGQSENFHGWRHRKFVNEFNELEYYRIYMVMELEVRMFPYDLYLQISTHENLLQERTLAEQIM